MGELESKIDEWLCALENVQRQAATLGFPACSIPSIRTYPLLGTKRQDPNVFFPALIASKLQEWKHLMSAQQAARAKKIAEGIRKTFPLYKSRRGRMHYNFWPTDTDLAFPNGKWLHRFDFFRLPDDVDDTAMVFDAMESNREKVFQLQQDIEQHFSTFYAEKHTLYAAWLGEKMPWVVDACAMINLIALFDKHDLEPTLYSTSSNLYLEKIVREGSYISNPYEVAPYYPDSAIIAYHLAKWLSQARIDNQLLVKFLQDVNALLAREVHPFKKMLYVICLLKLGETKSIVPAPLDTDYPWFYGTMLSAVKPGWLQRIGRLKSFHIAHSCTAWNQTLRMEYLILNEHSEKQ